MLAAAPDEVDARSDASDEQHGSTEQQKDAPLQALNQASLAAGLQGLFAEGALGPGVPKQQEAYGDRDPRCRTATQLRSRYQYL